MLKTRYVMIGGFLGAGKTTALLRVAEHLRSQGQRVGLITNDQSIGLVDTAMANAHGFPTEEISGGCFCCRFNSLVEASQRLATDARPDIFLAEPVGSCTDLVATVSYPLQKLYGGQYSVAPLSVLVDPTRAQRILGLKFGKAFSSKVQYIYQKQLEEAEIIVVNKTDLLDQDALNELSDKLSTQFRNASVTAMSSRTGKGVKEWMDLFLASENSGRAAMEIDYDTYADGEALLGWVNVSATIGRHEFDGNRFLMELLQGIQKDLQRLGGQRIEIAHLKTTLVPDHGTDIAVANLVRQDATCELSHRLVEPLQEGELVVNLRAEGDPEALRDCVSRMLQQVCSRFRLTPVTQHAEAFRPGRPTPTHRLASR